MIPIRIPFVILAAALMVGIAVPAPAAPPAADRPDSSAFLAVRHTREGSHLVPDPDVLREQVTEPLFGFVFSLSDADSLGTWTAADLLAFAEGWERESAFPVAEHLESIAREELTGDQVLRQRGAVCRRRWVINLKPSLAEFPLPFSILGYHPGTLSISTPLVLYEWGLGERSVHVTVDGATRRFEAEALTIWQIADGWLILDVDGWLDRLLGKAADDAANVGFAACRVDGQYVGVGVSLGRGGRSIYGEFDFATGEIANHGRPVARGIAQYSRGWTRALNDDSDAIWDAYEGR